jgi:ubiquinone/menaquinone biosynthesis C-methylase UbiE
MIRRLASAALDRVYRYRARWSARRLLPWVRPGERVLDIGAGDCYLDLELERRLSCTVVPVDVRDTNRTPLALQLYDGRTLPFPDRSFDVALLLFVLHHAADPAALLGEARRTARRIVAVEDATDGWWDRAAFRWSHRVYERLAGIEYPRREWRAERWSALAREAGLVEKWSGLVGRQGGYFAPRHLLYVWELVPA